MRGGQFWITFDMQLKLKIIRIHIEHQADRMTASGVYREKRLRIGVIAKAEVQNPATGVCQVLRSMGEWGVESNCHQRVLADVQGTQVASLKCELLAFGLGRRAIEFATKKIQITSKSK